MAVLCEAFPGRLPSEILSEIERLPVGMLDEILEARRYREAKGLIDAADTPEAQSRLPHTPLFEMVKEIECDLADEEIEKRRTDAEPAEH